MTAEQIYYGYPLEEVREMVHGFSYTLGKLALRPTIFSFTPSQLGRRSRSASMDSAVCEVRKICGPRSILVGQSVEHDVKWLGLRRDCEYGSMIDIAQVPRPQLQ